MSNKKLLIVLCLILLAMPAYAESKDRTDSFDPLAYASQIKQVEKYLSGFKTLTARFIQINQTKAVLSQGKIFIERPGKARWEYLSPEQILLVVKDGKLSFWDKELDQITYADLPPTPLEILLYNNVEFSEKTKVIDVLETDDMLTVIIAPTSTDNEFQYLEMEFSKDPLTLKRLRRADANNAITTIQLINPKFDKKLDEELFTFKNPRVFDKQKRN